MKILTNSSRHGKQVGGTTGQFIYPFLFFFPVAFFFFFFDTSLNPALFGRLASVSSSLRTTGCIAKNKINFFLSAEHAKKKQAATASQLETTLQQETMLEPTNKDAQKEKGSQGGQNEPQR